MSKKVFQLLCIAFLAALCQAGLDKLRQFEEQGIVPEVIPVAPRDLLCITYNTTGRVNIGEELTPTQVNDPPEITWRDYKDSFYTLVMMDPDAPTRESPTLGPVRHWLVVNIPGNNLDAGEVITEYLGSGPPRDTGLHRYVLLLYRQPGRLTFDEPRTEALSLQHRFHFNLSEFIQKYQLEGPFAGNFFLAQWDPFVDERNERITE